MVDRAQSSVRSPGMSKDRDDEVYQSPRGLTLRQRGDTDFLFECVANLAHNTLPQWTRRLNPVIPQAVVRFLDTLV
jgi:hypothetical protein